MNKSILILGGSGFLGSEIAKYLSKSNFYTVCGSVNKGEVNGVKSIYVDVLNKRILKNKCAPFDIVINCTGQITSPIRMCGELNTEGIMNIINACKNTNKKLIQISTTAIYGTTKYADENSPSNPETPYAAYKYFAEYLLQKNLPPRQFTIVRISNLYGPNQRQGIFKYLLDSYFKKAELFFNNDGSLSRFYMHVEDCAENITRLIQTKKYSGVYNLAPHKQYNIMETIALLERKTGFKFKTKYSEGTAVENIGHLSTEKIKKKIELFFKFSLEKYLTELTPLEKF